MIQWLEKNNLGWSRDAVDDVGANFIAALTDCLWYIDGHHSSLESRSCHLPVEFKHFQGYNNPEKSRHRRRDVENLSSAVLDNNSSILSSYLLQPWLESGKWKAIRSAVCGLADGIAKYSAYLKEKNKEVLCNHRKMSPVRVLEESDRYCLIKRAQWVKPTYVAQYRSLQQHIDAAKEYEPVFVNDFSPADVR